MLDVKRLQVLLSVVELGSVTAAADALVYTPSAVSQQLRRLEREVGQPLLRRHARGMSPTDAGLVLAAHARTVLRQLPRPRRTWPRSPGCAGQARPGHVSHRRQLVPAAGRAPVQRVCTRRSGWTSAATVNPSSSNGWKNGTVGPVAALGLRSGGGSTRRSSTSPSCSPIPPCCWCPPTTGWPVAGAWTSADLAEEEWVVRCDHPVVEVLRRGRGHGGVRAQGLVPRERLPGSPGDGRYRPGCRSGPAYRGDEPARLTSESSRWAARRRPAGCSSVTAGTASTRPSRPRSTSSSSRSGTSLRAGVSRPEAR